MFNIKDYMWNIFEITNYNHIDNIKIGLDLFIMNLELRKERYKGAYKINYDIIGKQWNSLLYAQKLRQKQYFNEIIKYNYLKLCKEFRSNRFDKFINLYNLY